MFTAMDRKALRGHKTAMEAVAHAERVGNVAFTMTAGTPSRRRAFTCTRSYVSNAINAGRDVRVLADHEAD